MGEFFFFNLINDETEAKMILLVYVRVVAVEARELEEFKSISRRR